MALIAVAISVVSLYFSWRADDRSYRQSQLTEQQTRREELTRLVTEIITLSHMPTTGGVEQAELTAAEVALPLTKELHQIPAIDFYEIGRAFFVASESKQALEVFKEAVNSELGLRPRVFALREEALLLYHRGEASKAHRALYAAKHAFDREGDSERIHIDYATTDLFEAAEARPVNCEVVEKDIAEAKKLMKRYKIAGGETIAEVKPKAEAHADDCNKHRRMRRSSR